MKFTAGKWSTHIESPSKQQAAYLKLKNAILTLELPPGSVLTERHIMDQFALSRTPMREAINQLQVEGFITSVSKNFVVKDLQYKDFIELCEVKEALESEAAYLCAIKKNSAIIANIEAALAAFSQSLLRKEHSQILLSDLNFHWTLIENSKNNLLMQEMAIIMDHFLKFFNMYYDMESTPSFIKAISSSHKNIFNAIKAGDPPAARQAVLEHIQEIKNFNLDMLYLG